MGEPERALAILTGSDLKAQASLLACARVLGIPLPVSQVGGLLQNRDESLSHAADAYLRTEDSPAARKFVLSRHPDEAIIIGARQRGDPGHHTYGKFDKFEQKLQKEILAQDGPSEIFAMMGTSYWDQGEGHQIVIYVRGDSAKLTVRDGPAQPTTRTVSAEELNRLRAFIADNKVENLGPLSQEVYDGAEYEYVHVSKAGGRRIFMNSPDSAHIGDFIYVRLVEYILKLADKEKMQQE